jgi:hypothetical protein
MNKKILLLLGIASVLAYCSPKKKQEGNETNNNSNNQGKTFALAQGCDLNQKEFDKAEVFEPLAKSLPENKTGRKASLLKYAPKRMSQGRQGSCTSWACVYATTTILHATASGKNPNDIAFSPAFVYNQMTRGNCTGTNIAKALDKLVNEGAVSLNDFPYTDKSCNTQPNAQLKQKAEKFKLRGYNRLTLKHDNYKIDMEAIKQNLSQGAPVVIGMAVGGTFNSVGSGGLWAPTKQDYTNVKKSLDGHIVDDGGGGSFGGHAMCVVGFDDDYEGGAFQIMNSWGADWGADGLFWMRYKDFEYFVNTFYGEAYGLYPLAKQKKDNNSTDFQCAIGLLDNQTKKYFPFKGKGGNVFETEDVLPKGTKFKIAVKNEEECYVYVFGQETDGSSYVLFPYTEKHSPFMGIVGARLFPKDHSLQLDTKGTKDVMAVIFTKEKINYKALNRKISESNAPTYQAKIADALGDTAIKQAKIEDGEKISFSAKSRGKNAMAIVFEIKKKKANR